jgi:hypothetical protein
MLLFRSHARISLRLVGGQFPTELVTHAPSLLLAVVVVGLLMTTWQLVQVVLVVLSIASRRALCSSLHQQ